jgi:hypothetical protein
MIDRIDINSSQSSLGRCSDLVDRLIDAVRPGGVAQNDQIRTSRPLGKPNIFPVTQLSQYCTD